ncbi:copper chaperone PCu(A)C [Denitrificimonas sp. JX-1]|uniref:Copper chaperone PCu(A)C n=1 Tax=Denitrificimonas halotolerans TaxID=3098930 RepID=A0ABU5GQB3_9GAMM|nr:copper chaperone PCu(A)C [Denitrificimonas sp. JX-1]MDY7218959.1 copper chaperone PCu(A)C [Denitrificimonas sp. JX-1]
MRLTALAFSIFALTFAATIPTYATDHTEHARNEKKNQAQQYTALHVDAAWSRELPPTAAVGAAFLTISNPTDQADRLIRAYSPIAAVTELHAHIHQDNIMRMVKVDNIEVPANTQLILVPGGYHIMLIDLKQPLVAGEQLPLTLEFEHAGEIELIVSIKSSAAGTSAEQHEKHIVN